jgi:hypothetical protein
MSRTLKRAAAKVKRALAKDSGYERTGMQQTDDEKQKRRLWLEERYKRWSAILKVWMFCGKSKCRRLQRCSGDMRRCGLLLGEHAKEFRLIPDEQLDAVQRDRRDFVVKAMERIAEKWRNLEPGEVACSPPSSALFSCHATPEGQKQD